jgi:hypothetical protein
MPVLLAAEDPFRPAGLIILRGGGLGEPRQAVAITPGDPLRRMLLQLRGVPQRFGDSRSHWRRGARTDESGS